MGLRFIQKTEVPKDEQHVLNLEARRQTEEGVFATLLESKKKLEKENELLLNSIHYLSEDEEIYKKEISALELKKKSLEEEVSENSKKLEEQKAKFTESLEPIEKQITTLEFEKAEATKQRDYLLSANESLTQEVFSKELSATAIEGKIIQLNATIDSLNAEIAGLEVTKEQKLSTVSLIAKDIEANQNEALEIAQIVSVKKEEAKRLESEINSKSQELSVLDSKIKETQELLRTENDRLKSRTKDLDERSRAVSLAEQRVDAKTEYLNKLVEDAKAKQLIKDFSIT